MPNLRYLDQIGVTIVSAAHGKIRRGELLAGRERGAREVATVKQWFTLAWRELGVQP